MSDTENSIRNSYPKPPEPEIVSEEPQPPPITSDKEVRAAWLAPFQYRQGVSGNPGGRPRKRPVAEALKFAGELPCPPSERRKLEKKLGVTLPKNLTLAQSLAVGQYCRAIRNTDTAKWVADKTDGPLAAELKIPGDGLTPRVPDILFQFVEVNSEGQTIRTIDCEAPPPLGEEPHQPPTPPAIAPYTPEPEEPIEPKPNGNGNGNGPKAA